MSLALRLRHLETAAVKRVPKKSFDREFDGACRAASIEAGVEERKLSWLTFLLLVNITNEPTVMHDEAWVDTQVPALLDAIKAGGSLREIVAERGWTVPDMKTWTEQFKRAMIRDVTGSSHYERKADNEHWNETRST